MASVEAAAAGDLGELFEYKLKQPVTIRRNQSALVPVVQADIAVERVSLWSAGRGVAQPLRAIWLTNDTGLTLDGGSVTLVEGGAFAGEGLVEPIKPGEKRFVSYAMDLGVRVTAVPQESARRVSRIRIASSVLTQSVEDRASTLYTIRNDDATPRDVVIEHPARAGWSLTSAVKPAETSADGAPLPRQRRAEVDGNPDRRRDAPDRLARHRHQPLRRPDRADPARPERRCRPRAAAARGRGEVPRAGEVQRAIYIAGRTAADRRRPDARPRKPQGPQGQRRRKGADRALHAAAVDAGGSPGGPAQGDRRRRDRSARRSSRSCRGWSRRCRSTSSCLDPNPLRAPLPDLAAHLAVALAGPLPGARIHDRLSPRLLDGSLPRRPVASGRRRC
jgi:hypothetical protein